jgi:UDP-glucose 4-epimerase
MENGRQGDLFVRKATSATVQVLAEALLSLFDASNPIEIVGVRAGEKLHEMLVTPEELTRAEEFEDYYRVPCEGGQDYDRYFTQGDRKSRFATEGYTSENAYRLSVEETRELLLALPEVQSELAGWDSNRPRLKVAA